MRGSLLTNWNYPGFMGWSNATHAQRSFAIFGLISAAILFYMIARSIKTNMGITAGLLLLLSSWLLAWWARYFYEANERLPGQFDFHIQSWMFLLDPLLALAGCVMAYAWVNPKVSQSYLVTCRWWMPLCLVVGLSISVLFYRTQVQAFQAFPGAIQSPTKVMHDGPTYTIISGSLLYGLGPLFRLDGFRPSVVEGAGWFVIAVMVLIGLWLLIGGVMHDWRGPLDLAKLHPQGFWTEVGFWVYSPR
jgi:ribose/xylose/arabinose/galactoside ABC-type transport system permease subunit